MSNLKTFLPIEGRENGRPELPRRSDRSEKIEERSTLQRPERPEKERPEPVETEKPISRLPGKNNDCIYPCIPCIEEVQIVQTVSDFVNCHHLECFLMLLVYKEYKVVPHALTFWKTESVFHLHLPGIFTRSGTI